MKSLVDNLWCSLYNECCMESGTACATRDITYVMSRVRDEGLSFYTITLPTFGADFERSLSQGQIDPTLFRSFRKSGGIPAFLQGILGLVFDRSGALHERPNVTAIKAIRQLSYFFKKVKLTCSDSRNKAAIAAYERVERDLAQLTVPGSELDMFRSVARQLWKDFEVIGDLPIGKHGPGATADKLTQSSRREWPLYGSHADEVFPLFGTVLPLGAQSDSVETHTRVVPEDESHAVRVILVPKTQKTPRVIAAELAYRQFCQQSVWRHIDQKLRDIYPQFLDLHDQVRNQSLASNVDLSTIDLSEASDRVHSDLVLHMLDGCPNLRTYVMASRSKFSRLPDGRVISLKKFASAGSALCFPIESMVFFTIVVMSYMKHRTSRNVQKALKELSGRCSVYGDDIIVPVAMAATLADGLETFGLKVNRGKSFWTGKFRESCGADYYDGVLVTPTYLRTLPGRRDPASIVSIVSTVNLLYSRGYTDTAALLATAVPSWVPQSLSEDAFGLAVGGKPPTVRWNASLHRREFKTFAPRAVTRRLEIDGWYGLTDWFHRAERSHDTQLGQERVRMTDLKLKTVWMPF